MNNLLRVATLARQLARYAPVLPALLDLLAEVRAAGADRRLSLGEITAIGQRLVDLLELVQD